MRHSDGSGTPVDSQNVYLVDAGLLNVDNLYALNHHPRTGEQERSRLRWAEDAWMGVGGCGCAE